MTSRRTGFRPGRLRQARQARLISQATLARLTNVSAQSISLYERGLTSPGEDTLQRLGAVLGVPVRYFFEPEGEPETHAAFYRSLSAATKGARSSCESQLEWLVEIASYLTQFVRLPAVDFPKLSVAASIGAISLEDAEDAANRCRAAWGLGNGPISNVAWLLENHGAIVARFNFGAESLDAMSRWSTTLDRPVILLNADKMSASRSRFDAAHELAHMVLHQSLTGESPESTVAWKQAEHQAHRFAAAFLLPSASFGLDIETNRSFNYLLRLKEKWGASIALMLHRARDLGVLDEASYRGANIALGRRGWRHREPLDDTIPVECPTLLRNCFKMVIDNGRRTATAIRQEMSIGIGDVNALAGLEPGLLSEPAPVGEIIAIPAVSEGGFRPREDGRAPIVHLPVRHED